MAIRRQGQMEYALGTTALALQAEADESIMVRGLYSSGATTDYVTITVGQRTVGYYRVDGALGNHLNWPTGFSTAGPWGGGNLFDLMFDKGWHRGFPIGSGQTMNWSGPNAAGSVNAVLYDVYDRDDIKPTMPNGSQSNELDYVCYGDTGATIATATTSAYDTVINPSEFDAFPFNVDVPGLTAITLYALLASTFAPTANDGTDDISTTYLKGVRNQSVLWDKDLNGLPLWQALGTQSADQIGAGSSLVGNFSSTDRRLPYVFETPAQFGPGEELTFSLSTQIDGSGQNILVTDQVLGCVMRSVRS